MSSHKLHRLRISRRDLLTRSSIAMWPVFGLNAAERGQPAHPQSVKRVIFLFMNGGPSQIDTFDPKPGLAKFDGTHYTGDQKIATADRSVGTLWKSDFRFLHHGESGLEISELFPNVAEHADSLCVIRSMKTTSSLHAPAMLEMNTGQSQAGAAGLGSWIDYGLSRADDKLPACIVMPDHRGGPVSGFGNWSTGQLPVSSPTLIHSPERPIHNLTRGWSVTTSTQRQMRSLLADLNRRHVTESGMSAVPDSRRRAYELAWKMQSAAPEATDLSQETSATQQMYGLKNEQTRPFGERCLLARRLLQRGVNFVQIYSGGGQQSDTWDSHTGHVKRHRQFAAETDQPVAALLADLKQTGLWNETLVVWGGEFGRTPTREGTSYGRDHNPHGFSMWLAGGRVKGGQVIGATDEIGFQAVENVCTVADLHATILHLLGLNHEELKFYRNGTEVGITGPEPCRVIAEVKA